MLHVLRRRLRPLALWRTATNARAKGLKRKETAMAESGGGVRPSGPALALVAAAVLGSRVAGYHALRPLGRDPRLRARRHRRQYADDAGPRPARRPGLVRSAASIGSTRRPAPTSTGRGWSTCRSPALKLLLHAFVRRPDRRDGRGRGRAACCRCWSAMAAVAVTVRRLVDAAAPSRSPSPCSPAPARRAACGRRCGSIIMAGSSRCSPGRSPP